MKIRTVLILLSAFVVVPCVARGQSQPFSGTLTGTGDGDEEWNSDSPQDDVDVSLTNPASSEFDVYVWVHKLNPQTGGMKWYRKLCVEPGDTASTNDHDDCDRVDIGGDKYVPPTGPDPGTPGTATYSGTVS